MTFFFNYYFKTIFSTSSLHWSPRVKLSDQIIYIQIYTTKTKENPEEVFSPSIFMSAIFLNPISLPVNLWLITFHHWLIADSVDLCGNKELRVQNEGSYGCLLDTRVCCVKWEMFAFFKFLATRSIVCVCTNQTSAQRK